MNTVRLFVGDRSAWAVVRCGCCSGVYKYSTALAMAGPLTCECGIELDVRDDLMAEIRTHARVPAELLRTMEDPGKQRLLA